MPKKKNTSVSVTEATHARLKRYCEAQGISMAQLIDTLTADIGAVK